MIYKVKFLTLVLEIGEIGSNSVYLAQFIGVAPNTPLVKESAFISFIYTGFYLC